MMMSNVQYIAMVNSIWDCAGPDGDQHREIIAVLLDPDSDELREHDATVIADAYDNAAHCWRIDKPRAEMLSDLAKIADAVQPDHGLAVYDTFQEFAEERLTCEEPGCLCTPVFPERDAILQRLGRF